MTRRLQGAAVGALLSMLSTLRAALGDLDRIDAWLTVTGFGYATLPFRLPVVLSAELAIGTPTREQVF